ncbi:GNAT family N-acetyltransferase [Streptomyces zingiberis]|uniref:GNAT family N-acetyltransferase n=1 Tax=Streptomyces zingiberis TaxID=2053010 RepID=A0ABX1BZ08_9ACTN|nr:GNAT family protein [Streptomyces zingiberis]NJQ02911.1 GNAT family N-acetyltransferase [Streptomyces zingiberis]
METLLTTPRLRFRELHGDDAQALHAVYGDPRATEHLSFEPLSPEQVRQLTDRWVATATADPRTEYALPVLPRDGEELIGLARLAMDPHQPEAATIGFALRPDHWGRGYGTETVRALMDLAFGSLGLHRLWAARSPANTASHHVLTKAGMVEEGRIRGHVHVRGAWRDSVTYSVLEEEWRAAR